MKTFLQPAYENFGGFVKKETEKDEKLRVLINSWACQYHVGNCVESAEMMFNNRYKFFIIR